jgi:hypothetical protein
VLTGAASVSTTERLLPCSGCGRRHPSHPSMTSWLSGAPLVHCTSGMTRGKLLLEFHGAESRLLGSGRHLGWPCASARQMDDEGGEDGSKASVASSGQPRSQSVSGLVGWQL